MKKKKAIGFLLLLPLTIWLVVFALYPILYGLRLSFFNARINNIDNPTFIGLQNYIKLFSNSEFGQALLWSLKFALIATFIQMLLGQKRLYGLIGRHYMTVSSQLLMAWM